MRRTEFRVRLLPPEAHVHLSVHPGRGGQVLLGLYSVPDTTVELAQAQVAVGLQRTHLEFVGPREGLGIVPLG